MRATNVEGRRLGRKVNAFALSSVCSVIIATSTRVEGRPAPAALPALAPAMPATHSPARFLNYGDRTHHFFLLTIDTRLRG